MIQTTAMKDHLFERLFLAEDPYTSLYTHIHVIDPLSVTKDHLAWREHIFMVNNGLSRHVGYTVLSTPSDTWYM